MNVASTSPLRDQFLARVRHRDGCWIWTGSHNAEHPQFSVTVAGARRRWPARQWAFVEFVRPLESGEVVLAGSCGPSCVAPEHARVTTLSAERRVDDAERERRFWARVDKTTDPTGCWLWTGPVFSSSGYGQAPGPTHHPTGAHRMALTYSSGAPIAVGLQACHHCDTPLCCRPDHLYAGTPQQNIDDRQRRGRHRITQGPDRANSKLTADQVREIRALHASGKWSYPKLAERYGIHAQNVGRIVRREGYKNVP